MPRPPAEPKHGRTRYNRGCRCPVCRKANQQYGLRYRQQKADRAAARVAAASTSQTSTGALVPPLATPETSEPRPSGEVEQAVREELKAHDGAQGTIALSAIAIALAREIDERAVTSVSGAARQLVATLTEVRKASVKVDDELASFLSELGS